MNIYITPSPDGEPSLPPTDPKTVLVWDPVAEKFTTLAEIR